MWRDVLFKNSYSDFQTIQRATPQLVFNFIGDVAFAFIFGLLYLHVPIEKRNTRGGKVLGTIPGLLVGLWIGHFIQ